jgi:hypothetical protein
MREQRGCKVALLINAEKLGDKKDEFEGLLEKVVEARRWSSLQPRLTAIALPGQDPVSVALRRTPQCT